MRVLPASVRGGARLRHALSPARALVAAFVVLVPVAGLAIVASGSLPETPCDLSADPTAVPRRLPAAGRTDRREAPHVMVVVLENQEACSVLTSGKAPFLERTARTYGLATRSYARTHPSLPNHLELLAGTTFGITENCNDCTVEGTTLVDQLERKRIDWKAYMGGADGRCYLGASTSAGYDRSQNPFVHVRHIVENPRRCRRVAPLSDLDDDLGSGTASFIWVAPNLCRQGRDCGTAPMDRWLSTFLPAVQRSTWYRQGGIVILTSDEGVTSAGCCNGADGGHIPTIVVAEHARGARLRSPITHAGVLRGIERLYGLPLLAKAQCACSGDLFPLLEDTTRTGRDSTDGVALHAWPFR